MTTTLDESEDDLGPTREPGPAPAGWDRYELGRELGRGGMGVVHEARDRRLGRTVALKFLRSGDPRASLRLLQEARAQARIDHPHVCKIFEVDEVNGRPYIAMKLVAGRPLGELAPGMSLHDKVSVIRDVALGLHEAHTLGVLHRDVKPANILVEELAGGRLHAVVMDFGLARQETEQRGLTETGALLGTPAYMSPEQARGEHRLLDRRSDVYSLGATLYEILGGAPPFEGDTAVKVLLRVLHEEPPPLRARAKAVPEDLETIAAKCLAREPERRYDSARAVADELDRYIRGEPILGRKATVGYRLWRQARRHRALLAAAALAAVALAIALGVAIQTRLQARVASQTAQEVSELEWFLRTAYLLPAHDLSIEEALVRERIQGIAARAGGGALADFALGRGQLALHEDELARASLERALDGGLDTPELHHARGLVLGRLYDRAVTTARSRGQGRWLEEQMEESERRYLRPALASLERSRGARLESRDYLEGLIAYYRGDLATALAQAEAARQQAPWLYEATRLEADAHLARAVKLRGRDRAAALADLDAAARLYDAALEVGRSDGGLYLGRAEVWIQRSGMAMAWAGATQPAETAEVAGGWCRRAAVIAPRATAPEDKLALLLIQAGMQQLQAGADPTATWRRAVAAAGRALALDEHDVDAHVAWGGARCYEADYDLDRGLDPSEAIAETIAQLRRAIALEPRLPRAHNALGLGYTRLGQYQASIGADPIAAYGDAMDELAAAVRLDPTTPGCRNQLGVLDLWARHLTRHGRDPALLAPAVEAALAGCLAATQGAAYCSELAGSSYETFAAHELDAGRAAAADLARAGELITRAGDGGRAAAELDLLRLRVAVRDGGDDTAARAALARSVTACQGPAARDPVCARLDAEGALLEGGAKAGGRARDLAAGRARDLAAAAVALDPRSADAAQLLAEAELRLGHIDAGLAACARGLAVNPDHPRLLATQGALLLSRQSNDAAGRAALAHAFALNPLLARTFPAIGP